MLAIPAICTKTDTQTITASLSNHIMGARRFPPETLVVQQMHNVASHAGATRVPLQAIPSGTSENRVFPPTSATRPRRSYRPASCNRCNSYNQHAFAGRVFQRFSSLDAKDGGYLRSTVRDLLPPDADAGLPSPHCDSQVFPAGAENSSTRSQATASDLFISAIARSPLRVRRCVCCVERRGLSCRSATWLAR